MKSKGKKNNKGKKKIVVMWFGRETPLPIQLKTLREKLGEFQFIHYGKRVSTAAQAIKIVEDYGATHVIPILPMTFISHLVAEKPNDLVVIYARMKKLHYCSHGCLEFNPETDVIVKRRDFQTRDVFYQHMRFDGFEIIKSIEMITEPL